MSRAAFIAAARDCIGTKFQHQARMPGVGIDCVGLVIVAAKRAGLLAEDFAFDAYPRIPDGRSLLAECDRVMDRIHRSELAIGDVIVIRYGSDPQHLAVIGDYIHGGMSMIHAYHPKVVEHHFDKSHDRRVRACYRLRGIE